MKTGKIEHNGRMIDCKIINEYETTYRISIATYCNGRYNGTEEFTVAKDKVQDIK